MKAAYLRTHSRYFSTSRSNDAILPIGDSYVRRVDMSLTNRGDAAGATWIFRGNESRRRRGRDVDIPL